MAFTRNERMRFMNCQKIRQKFEKYTDPFTFGKISGCFSPSEEG